MKKFYMLLIVIPTILPAQSPYQSIDAYWNASNNNVFKEIATAADKLTRPNDLDFNPMKTNGPMELWVINEEFENTGGSTVTILNAGQPNQQNIFKKDGNSWHFMALPTGMAFGEGGDWGSSTGIYDANRSGGLPYTGPSLWSGDLGIYAITPPGGNGSHLDMLHQSPYSMGIAHEKDNVYWVFDGFNSTLVRYDFVFDHGPGNSNHDDGKVHFYTEVNLSRDHDGVPGHMALDKKTNWLYICDTDKDRIIRVNIMSGTKKSDLPFHNEVLAERWEMKNVVQEVVVSAGLSRPCGIDVYGNRLIVTDNGSNEIIIYDIAENPVKELGRFSVSYANPNIRGVKVGPMGKIWFVDYSNNKLYRIDNNFVFPLGVHEQQQLALKLWPNPTSEILLLQGIEQDQIAWMKLYDGSGREVDQDFLPHCGSSILQLDVSHLRAGIYLVSMQTNSGAMATGRFVKN